MPGAPAADALHDQEQTSRRVSTTEEKYNARCMRIRWDRAPSVIENLRQSAGKSNLSAVVRFLAKPTA